MRRIILLFIFMSLVEIIVGQTKFSGIVINQKFTDLVRMLNTKYTLVEPDYEKYKKEGYPTHVAHKYYINFLGTDNTRLVVHPNYKENDAVESIEIDPPYLCFLSLKDEKCEESLRHYLQHLKTIYESKYGQPVLEFKTEYSVKETIYKWDLDDVIISIILYEPTIDILGRSAMTVRVKYEVKYVHIKNKGTNLTIQDI